MQQKTLTDLRYKVSGLTEGHEYEFRVMAENAAGISAPSATSPFYKACDVFKPGPPGNPRVQIQADHPFRLLGTSLSMMVVPKSLGIWLRLPCQEEDEMEDRHSTSWAQGNVFTPHHQPHREPGI